MIEPNLNQKKRFGIQGGVSFDATNVNVPLYKDLEKFLKGDLGFGGSGGQLASKPRVDNGFQMSHVFNTTGTRKEVQQRLERQLTEYLQSTVGEQATAQNMSIPDFLQSQGIRGVSQNKAGNLSAFKTDNFVEASWNPISGSNERLTRAYLKGIGAPVSVSGGSNEFRRNTAFLRPRELDVVNERATETAQQMSAGVYNKSGMEGAYISAADKIDVKNRQEEIRNTISTYALENRSPNTVAAIKSKYLKQQAAKDLDTQVRQEMEASGELTVKDKKEEKRRESPAAMAAKGGVAAIFRIWTVLSTVKNMVGSMVAFLTKISMDMGRLVKDSSELGIDPNEAKRLQNWAIANPTYTGGNDNLLLDAMKEINDKFGDLPSLDKNANFTSAAFSGYAKLINLTVDTAINRDPVGGTKKILGHFAERYSGMEGKEAKEKELQIQMKVLKTEYGEATASAYVALIRAATAQGLKIDNNLINNSINPDRVNKLQTTKTPLDNLLGTNTDAVGIEHGTQSLNAVLGDVAKIQNALYMMLLSNMDIIIQLILGITKLILQIMAKLEVPGASKALERITKTESKMAQQGFQNYLENSEKFKEDSMSRITEYLKEQGLSGDELKNTAEDYFNKISNNQALPAKHAGMLKGENGLKIVAGNAIYNKSQEEARKMYPEILEGNFITSGNAFDMSNTFSLDARKKMDTYNLDGTLKFPYVQGVEGRSLSRGKMEEIKKTASGENAVQVPQDLNFYQKVDEFLYKLNPLTEKGTQLYEPTLEMPSSSYYPKPKDKKLTLPKVFSALPLRGLFDSSLAEKFGGAALAGSGATGNEPFEVINHIKLTINGKEVMTNIENLSDDSRRLVSRSINAKFAGPMG